MHCLTDRPALKADSLPVKQPATSKAEKLTPALPRAVPVERTASKVNPIFGPQYYMIGPTSELTEATAIILALLKRHTSLIEYLVRREISLPGDLPLADTWGNLKFLEALTPPWLTKDSVDAERKLLMNKFHESKQVIVNLPFYRVPDKYGVSMRIEIESEVSIMRLIIRD